MAKLKRKYWILMLTALFLICISTAAYLFKDEILNWISPTEQTAEQETEERDVTALMLLIEFEDTTGLENFVYQMDQRDIPGLLMVNTSFVEENCSVIKDLGEHNIDIVGLYPTNPLWDVAYEEQLGIMEDTKEKVEACTGTEMKVFASKYFAYDENTIKAAEELGIEYVMARGTTGAKATIYQPDEYEVKIVSVSNVSSPSWGTGSLCDYSYWAREGKPEDFSDELYGAYETYTKISPVSHTYIGGLKERWNEIYVDFFDNTEINWVTLEEFGVVDQFLAFEDIPDNREVQYETPKPEIPLDEEVEVNNPCSVVSQDSEETSDSTSVVKDSLIIFHNGTGPMCIEALDFLKENNIEYTEYLTSDASFSDTLTEYKDEYGYASEGMSSNFGYYPFIFYNGVGYSGFNDEIKNDLLD